MEIHSEKYVSQDNSFDTCNKELKSRSEEMTSKDNTKKNPTNSSPSLLTEKSLQSQSDSDSGFAIEDYAWSPPGLNAKAVPLYFFQIPKHKIPLINSVGERYRVQQIIHQLPPQDFDWRYCGQLSKKEKKEMQKFIDYRKEKGLGRGIVMHDANFNKYTCKTCRKSIRQGIAIFSHRFHQTICWHPSCFICCVCRELLVDLVYCTIAGLLFCERHYAETMKPRCAGCDELIFSDECTEAENRNWHTSHFRCFQCSAIICGNEYIMKAGWPFCIVCFEQVFSRKCKTCKAYIKLNENEVNYEKSHWHANRICFHCYRCFASLVDRPFILNGNKTYCSQSCINECKFVSIMFDAIGSSKMSCQDSSNLDQCPPLLISSIKLSKAASQYSLRSSNSSLLLWAQNMFKELQKAATIYKDYETKSTIDEPVMALHSTKIIKFATESHIKKGFRKSFWISGQFIPESVHASVASDKKLKSPSESSVYPFSEFSHNYENDSTDDNELQCDIDEVYPSNIKTGSKLARNWSGSYRNNHPSLTQSWKWINFNRSKQKCCKSSFIKNDDFIFDSFQEEKNKKASSPVNDIVNAQKKLNDPTEMINSFNNSNSNIRNDNTLEHQVSSRGVDSKLDTAEKSDSIRYGYSQLTTESNAYTQKPTHCEKTFSKCCRNDSNYCKDSTYRIDYRSLISPYINQFGSLPSKNYAPVNSLDKHEIGQLCDNNRVSSKRISPDNNLNKKRNLRKSDKGVCILC